MSSDRPAVDCFERLDAKQLEKIANDAIEWALGHGFALKVDDRSIGFAQHAPFSLLPMPVPRSVYEAVVDLQPLFNLLYYKVSRDDQFLREALSRYLMCVRVFRRFLTDCCRSKSDPFITNLLKVLDERTEPAITVSISRSDYLLQHDSADSAELRPLQVEFNTIAASFASLATFATDMHHYLLAKHRLLVERNIPTALPNNFALESVVNGIALGWRLYDQREADVLMVVPENERNVFDQRWIEFQLLKLHHIRTVRHTLDELAEIAALDDSKSLFVSGRHVAVVYYRAGYTPEQYSSERTWTARGLLEKSRAVKCPDVAYQLAGMKKIQQVLTQPGVLERFLSDHDSVRQLRSVFAGLYSLDDNQEGNVAAALALERPDDFVMKPQKEGGGHNLYGQSIVDALRRMTAAERASYILMERIRPVSQSAYLVRKGQVVYCEDVVGELGIYGVFVARDNEVLMNESGGHLLRTKPGTVDEGGVATGFAVLDSPLLT